MPHFLPFRAIRYAGDTDVTQRSSPPYDVFDESERERRASSHPHNFVHVDYPLESQGEHRYDMAADTLASWVRDGVMALDEEPSYSIYRMTFVDEAGRHRATVGIVGALEVVDEGAGGVLPHERTTPKAKTDRLDLTRSTKANLSPVWGLSLAQGLSDALAAPGEVVATCVDEEGVRHTLEKVVDPERLDVISGIVGSADVLIADGHHRYAVSRTYRDEARTAGGPEGAELTMTYVQELVQEQLSVAAIHRLYDIDSDSLMNALRTFFDISSAGVVDASTIAEMDRRGSLCLVDSTGRGTYLTPRPAMFESIRDLDSARLEHVLSDTPHTVRYQHGVVHVLAELSTGAARSAILIRPVSLGEIRRTAETGDLMPPKSTFFTPKLRSGMIVRPLE
ncbi:MAG: DUF1015 family protein [Ilumatobacteraceae bacterium]